MQRLFLFGAFVVCNVLQAGELNLSNLSTSPAVDINFSIIENALNTTSTNVPTTSFVDVDWNSLVGFVCLGCCLLGIHYGCKYKEKCKNCIRPSEQYTH